MSATGEEQKIVIIAGSGRSGTTWVQDSLANANEMNTLFEPLHPIGVKKAGVFAHRYIKANANVPELRAFMDDVFSGNMNSLWANYRIRPDRFNIFHHGVKDPLYYLRKFLKHFRLYSKKNKKGMVIKFTRANLMLPWLVKQYQLPIILIVRHPCAVIVSRFNLPNADWGAQKALDRYCNNEEVVQLITDQFDFDITQQMSAVAAMTCVWCIENVLPVKWADVYGYGVVAYENLLMHPETEWQRLADILGLPAIPGREKLEKPSQQAALAMRDSVFTATHLEKWRGQLKPGELEEVTKVLEQFKCDFYTVDSSLPQGLNDVREVGT